MTSLLALCSLLLGTPGGPDVAYLDASLDVDGTLLSAQFVNADDDPRPELCLVVLAASGRRELRVHDWTSSDLLERTPRRVVPILEDVICWTLADVRDEPGPELVFLTRSGAHAMSLAKEGLRGNIARLCETRLLYRVPDPRACPYWPWVLDRPDRDLIVLPFEGGFAVFGPAEDGYEALATFAEEALERDPEPDRRGDVRMSDAGFGVALDRAFRSDVLLPESRVPFGSFYSTSIEARAPGLCQVDGDGVRDLLVLRGDELHVFLSGSLGDEPSRIEPVPDYVTTLGEDARIRFEDLDGDGDTDLVVTVENSGDDGDGFEDSDRTLLLLENDGERLFPEAPAQTLRFRAAELDLTFTDVDGDGTPDLFVRAVNLPSLASLATGFRFKMTSSLHLGSEGRFESKPALKSSRTYDESSIQGAIAQRSIGLDCSGDGIADLVEIDLKGRIAMRRVQFESSFFGGDRWTLEEAPWKRFDTRGAILRLDVADWNGDGLADVLSTSADRVTVLLSRSSEGGRR